MSEVSKPPGRIITFYSYKGGTGRSMAMANVAWILALSGAKVCVIDWDLEAPGLHRYFRPFLDDPDLAESEGLIDFATHVVEGASEQSGEVADPDWYKPLSNLLPYARELNYNFPGDGTLDFISAGRQDSAYAVRVNSFNWKHFYEKLGGRKVLEEASAILKDEYEFVLIDSRTGVSDTAGICTVQMPDDLVVCFTLNLQSVIGASSVAASVIEQRSQSEVPVRVFPIPTRVERAEKIKTQKMKDFAKPRFLPLLPQELSPDERDLYWERSDVPYEPFYAFEENLAYFRDELNSGGSVLAAMKLIAKSLAGTRPIDLPRIEPARLAEVVAAYDAISGPSSPLALSPRSQTPVYLSTTDDFPPAQLRQTLDSSGFEILTRERFEKSRDAMFFLVVASSTLSSLQSSDLAMASRVGASPIYVVLLPGVVPENLPRLLLPFAVIDLRDGQPFVLPQRSGGDLAQRLPIAPYPGLNPFTANDEFVFFARSAVLDQLVKAVTDSNFVGVIGPSGSGKTSLIQAGLIPRLTRSQPEQFWDIRFSWPTAARTGGRVLVIVDLRILAATSEISIPENVCVLVEAQTREQLFYCETRLRVSAERIEIAPLSDLELMQVITEPAARAGLHIPSDLAQRLVTDLRSERRQLPTLQFIMAQLYNAEPRCKFSLEKYEGFGGIQLIERLCESICGPEDFDWLSRLIALGDDDSITLQDVPNSMLPARSRRQADQFIGARILVQDGDSLRFANRIFVDRWPRLLDWLKDNRSFLLWRQRLVQSMTMWQVNPVDFRLLSGDALAEATQRADQNHERLSEPERDYIFLSEKRELSAATPPKPVVWHRVVGYLSILLVAALLIATAVWYFRPPSPVTVLLDQTSIPSIESLSSSLKQNGFAVDQHNGQPQPPNNTVWYSPDVSSDRISVLVRNLQSVGLNPALAKSSLLGAHTISFGQMPVDLKPAPGPTSTQKNRPCSDVTLNLYVNSIAKPEQKQAIENKWHDLGLTIDEQPYDSRQQSANAIWHGKDVPLACWYAAAATLIREGLAIRDGGAPTHDSAGKHLSIEVGYSYSATRAPALVVDQSASPATPQH